ncbi:MAG: alpha-(1-_3)-arabinofuranosyltransferase [Acidimicrobiales bacterium]|nr:alpha-(1->3)-arabinofuranosyltransferase [Acidimicrobiales bacterium]
MSEPEQAVRRRRDWLTVVVPAVVAYVPLLLTQPGQVGADTKTYLYLDPAALLRDAAWMWDSQIGLGTVTHQNIGYLFPMGPFYLVLDRLGLPDWTSQRLWLGTVLFAAGMGVRYLLHVLGWGREGARRGGLLVAVLAYMLSPYLLNYEARISVILLPWAALGWLVALTAQSVRHGGWRYPAWFAFVVLLVGGINATALIMIGWGPALMIVHQVWLERSATVRQALAATGRIVVLSLLTSLWWIAGLWAEGRYGLPVIRYTETYRTVAEVSNAPEVLRGLGYWFFYGSDKLGPWIEPSVEYTNRTLVLALSYGLVVAALVAAAFVRWRYRPFFLAILATGALTAVAAHPWDAPSLLGSLFKAFTRTDAGLSLRSTPRAGPLVVLATSVLLGVGIDALGRRLPRLGVPLAALTTLLVLANLSPLWTGTMVAENLRRDEALPPAWEEAVAALDAGDHGTRIWEIPGSDFASYRWGNTVDPITPGLTERPYVARELFAWGSPQSADLLNAIDRRIQEDTLDPEALVPVAQLLGVGDVVVRADLAYERYRTPRPRLLWDLIRRTPGLADPRGFGDGTPNVAPPELPLLDEVEQATPRDLEHPPQVGIFPLEDPYPIIRATTASEPLLLAGNGEGIVDAAAVGLVNPEQPIFSSAWFTPEDATFDTVYDAGADLVLTDTNRKQGRRWGTLRENTGYTERAGEEPLEFDPTDQRLEVFPETGDDVHTVSIQQARPGLVGATVSATSYGNLITFTADDRAANALDGDPDTAWRAGAGDDVTGKRIIVELDEPVTIDHLDLLQVLRLDRNRWITRARIHLDDTSFDVELTDASRAVPGQTVEFPERSVQRVEVEVLDTSAGRRVDYAGLSSVGFAEIGIPGVGIEEVIRMPTDLLDRAGTSSADHRLAVVATRLRSNPAEPVRLDAEPSLVRLFELPTARTFSWSGDARLSASVPGPTIDTLLGLPDATEGGVTADADATLPGDLRARASAAIDGDPDTAWSPGYLGQEGHWLQFTASRPVTFDRLDLRIVADGRHSLPTVLGLEVDGERAATLEIPPVTEVPVAGSTVSVPLELPTPLTGTAIGLVVEQVDERRTRDWFGGGVVALPVGIAEVGIEGLELAAPTGELDTGCRSDLVSVDGTALPVRITGTVDDALDRRALTVSACGPDAPLGTGLGPGDHTLRTAPGADTGLDIDRLLLASDRGGTPRPPTELPTEVPPAPPSVVTDQGRVTATVEVRSDEAFWLVLGQSWSDGWVASVDGRDLGTPVLVNGYANGWYVESPGDGAVTVSLRWAPQRVVWAAIGASAVGFVLCLVLMVVGTRHRRDPDPAPPTPSAPELPEWRWPWQEPTVATIGRRSAVTAAVGLGLFTALNLPTHWAVPLLAVPLGAGLWVVLRRSPAASWPAVVGAGALITAAAYIVVQQLRQRYAPDFSWPTRFDRVHVLGLVTVFCAAADAVRDALVRRGEDTLARVGADPAAADDQDPGYP